MRNLLEHHSFSVRRLLPLLFLLALLTAGWFVDVATIEAIPLCVIRAVSGIECPGCGLTRSFLSMARFDLAQAFRFNAAGPLIYLVFGVTLVESVIRLFRASFRFNWPTWLVGAWGGAIVVTLFLHWIFRIQDHLGPPGRFVRDLIG